MCGHLVGAAFLAFILLLPSGSPGARSWIVSLDGSGDFIRVSDALSGASHGDSILIEPGNYDEYDGMDSWTMVLEKSLTLFGLGSRPEDARLRLNIFFETCEEVVCENLLFHHDEQPLRSFHGNLTVRSCRFEDNEGEGFQCFGGAIQSVSGTLIVLDSYFLRNKATTVNLDFENAAGGAVNTTGPAQIERCTFVDNEALGSGGAIWGGADIAIEDCVFFRNKARNGAAIYLYLDPSVHRCTFLLNEIIDGNGACVEAWADWFNYEMFTHCIVAKTVNGWGVECNYGKNLECTNFWMNERGNILGFWCTESPEHGNFTADPLFCDEETGDVGLLEGSPCLPENSPQQCGRIGARGLGCGEVAVRTITWGGIKTLYR
jgi:hypothetical protein